MKVRVICYQIFVSEIKDCPDAVEQVLTCKGAFKNPDQFKQEQPIAVFKSSGDCFCAEIYAVHKSQIEVELEYFDVFGKRIKTVRKIPCVALQGIAPFVLEKEVAIKQWGSCIKNREEEIAVDVST